VQVRARNLFDVSDRVAIVTGATGALGGAMARALAEAGAQVVGRVMADRRQGVVLNLSSLAADRPLTRVVGYGGAKAAVEHFTKWLAVYLAREISPTIRVNAITPGFYETDQNRPLLRDPNTGALSDRGQRILAHTPLARFGEPDDLIGTMLWLISDAARFVTGITVPVDGGFSAYAGV
jgi:NAD(P)-dependent dehydrogenase (short-subunit alcohol dehydrogenase family)